MKKTFVVLAAALVAATAAPAQEPAARSPRVAVIDMARVSAESLLGKSYASQLEKLQTEINAEATRKQTELGKLDTALKTLQEELEKQGAVLSPEARDKKQQEIVAGMFKLAQGAQAQTGETLRTAISQNPYLGATLSAPNISF